MKKIIAILITSCGLAASASAAVHDGFYANAFVGPNWIQCQKEHGFRMNFDTGFVLGGSLGYRFWDCVKLEGELSYRRNSISSFKWQGGKAKLSSHHSEVDVSSRGKIQGSANVASLSYMVNAIYSFNINCYQPRICNLTSYVGLGAGYGYQMTHLTAVVREKKSKYEDDTDIDGKAKDVKNNPKVKLQKHSKDHGFAWQAIAGLGYRFTSCIDTSIEYRFHHMNTKLYNHALTFTTTYNF